MIEMDACMDMGIPHSQFLGGDATWSEMDRVKVVAYRMVRAEECPNCGTRPDQWVDAEGRRLNPFAADMIRCEGCARVEELQAQLDKDSGSKITRRGVRVALVPIE